MSKKRLSVVDLLVSREFRVLSDLENRMVVAGSGTWDCTFNHFATYLANQGFFIDKSDLIFGYCAYYGISISNLENSGGVEYGLFGSFITATYQISMDQIDHSTISSFTSSHVMSIQLDNSGIGHTVTPLEVVTGELKDRFGNEKDGNHVKYYDPLAGGIYYVHEDDIKGFFLYEILDYCLLGQYFGAGAGYHGY